MTPQEQFQERQPSDSSCGTCYIPEIVRQGKTKTEAKTKAEEEDSWRIGNGKISLKS